MDEASPLLRRSADSHCQIRNSKLYLAVISAVLGSFIFGYSMVYPSAALPQLQSPDVDPRLRMDKTQTAWFGSIFMLGAAAGGLIAMVLNDLIGRKMCMMSSALPSSIGFMLLGGATDLWMLHLGRFLTGVAGGLTSASIPVYISEISHQRVRGTLGTFPQITAVLGGLVLYFLGLWLPWRWLAVAGEVPVLLMVFLLMFMPSSPRRLLSVHQDEEADKSLRWLRGDQYDTDMERNSIKVCMKAISRTIFVLMCASVQESISMQTRLTRDQLLTPRFYKPILISVVMRFLQQMTGITPILVYLEPIFAQSRVSLAAQYDAVIVGVVRLLSVTMAASLMDKAGRKALLYTSSILMFLSSLTLTVTSHNPCSTNSTMFADYSSHNTLMITLAAVPQTGSSLPIISTVVFIFGYAMGWGPITWLLMSEILPLAARGVASGVCVAVSWLTAFWLTHAFTYLVLAYGLVVPYFAFTVVCVFCLLFTATTIPETRGRTLEEIEDYFRTGRAF